MKFTYQIIYKANYQENGDRSVTLGNAGSFVSGDCLFPSEVRYMEQIQRKVSQSMSVFQALSLMLAFATLMILIDRHNDRK